MTACLFQHSRPDDIIFLIETGFQFHQYCDLLAVLGGLSQCRNNGRIAADTIQGLFDSQYFRISRRLTDEIHHRRKALERMM